MAGIVADYRAIAIGDVRAQVGPDIDRVFEFDLPGTLSRVDPVIVSFLLVFSADLRMRIELNGIVISDRQYTNGVERCIQDIARDIPFFEENRGNRLVFTVLQGEVIFSDVVLWFQREA